MSADFHVSSNRLWKVITTKQVLVLLKSLRQHWDSRNSRVCTSTRCTTKHRTAFQCNSLPAMRLSRLLGCFWALFPARSSWRAMGWTTYGRAAKLFPHHMCQTHLLQYLVPTTDGKHGRTPEFRTGHTWVSMVIAWCFSEHASTSTRLRPTETNLRVAFKITADANGAKVENTGLLWTCLRQGHVDDTWRFEVNSNSLVVEMPLKFLTLFEYFCVCIRKHGKRGGARSSTSLNTLAIRVVQKQILFVCARTALNRCYCSSCKTGAQYSSLSKLCHRRTGSESSNTRRPELVGVPGGRTPPFRIFTR